MGRIKEYGMAEALRVFYKKAHEVNIRFCQNVLTPNHFNVIELESPESLFMEFPSIEEMESHIDRADVFPLIVTDDGKEIAYLIAELI